jgi:hypothetical protein
MQLVKVVKKTNSKIDQAKTMLAIFCLLSDIRLSQTELTVLAYFLVYKINDNTKDLIIKSEILNEDSLRNTMSKLSKFGLIKRSPNKEYYVSEKISINPDTRIGMLIEIDNS